MLEGILLSVVLVTFAPPQSSCVIAKIHNKTGADKWRWTIPRPYEYVEGEFPSGAKFRHELSDKNVREIKQKGGKFVVVQDSYTLEELKDARERCKESK